MRKRVPLVLLAVLPIAAADWPRFRGPLGSGLGEGPEPPAVFNAAKNVTWKTAVPPGHSSPVICGGQIYLTSFGDASLRTHAIDAKSGRIAWTRELPRERQSKSHALNNAASPTPSCDESGAVVFFSDFGLAAWSRDGSSQWQVKLPAMINNHGMGSSPMIDGSRVIFLHGSDSGSTLLVYDRRSGKAVWQQMLPGVSYATPAVGSGQVVTLATGEIAAFDVTDGKRRWWAKGLPYQPKASPFLSADGRLLFFSIQSVEEKSREAVRSFDKLLAAFDVNGDGQFTAEEMRQRKGPAGIFSQLDINGDGVFDRPEHERLMKIAESPHIAGAIGTGSSGDVTGKFAWSVSKGVPNVASPILVNGTLFLFKEGGILTSLDAATGTVHKEGRIDAAFGAVYSSPVSAGGRIYVANQQGKIAVVKAEPAWEVLGINDLEEDTFATPAIAEGAIFVRTSTSLWRFDNPR